MGIQERVRQHRFPSRAGHAFVGVVVAGEVLGQAAGELCRRFGITGDQYNVLRILRGAHPLGYSRGEIRQRLMRRAPDVTRMLDRLSQQGLVSREPGETDRRVSHTTITPEGLELLDRLDPEMEQLMVQLTSPLSEAELRELVRLCEALIP